MWLRSFETSPIRGTSPSMTNSLTLADWWKHNEDEKKDFLKNMEIICSSSIKDSRNVKHDITVAFEEYINKGKNINSKAIYLLRTEFLMKLKKKLINILKKNSWFPFFLKNSLIKSAKLLEEEDIKVYWNELVEIEKLLKIFYKNQNNLSNSSN